MRAAARVVPSFGPTVQALERITTSAGDFQTPAPTSRTVALEERYRSRLPETLDDLAGPSSGTVQLPLHVAWSGQTAFNLDLPKARMHMYRIVLAEGQRGDVAAYLNRDLLLRQWPTLRNLVSRTVRKVWEATFPELVEDSQPRPRAHATSVGGVLKAAPTSIIAVLEGRYRSRLPEILDDLAGPGHGIVQLPTHIAWSGLTAFDVDRPRLCTSMYQVVLTEGLQEDLAAYLNRGLLIRHWPTLRKVAGFVIRDVWEAAFPELIGRPPLRS